MRDGTRLRLSRRRGIHSLYGGTVSLHRRHRPAQLACDGWSISSPSGHGRTSGNYSAHRDSLGRSWEARCHAIASGLGTKLCRIPIRHYRSETRRNRSPSRPEIPMPYTLEFGIGFGVVRHRYSCLRRLIRLMHLIHRGQSYLACDPPI